MIRKLFLDSDVILDTVMGRQEFYQDSSTVLGLVENRTYQGVTSSNCIANVYYVLRSKGGDQNARALIQGLLNYIQILPITHTDVVTALNSPFSDFEDSLQHETAKNSACDVIITRNLSDYKHASLPVCSPTQFLESLSF